MLFTLAFLKGAAERAIKTGAQTLGAYFAIGVTGVLEFDWIAALSVTAASMIASLLTSISSADFVAGTPTVTATHVVQAKYVSNIDGDTK